MENHALRFAATDQRDFTLDRSENSELVSNYWFEDADRERCIFVQFGKGSVSHYRVVQLYRCDLRSEITLGLG